MITKLKSRGISYAILIIVNILLIIILLASIKNTEIYTTNISLSGGEKWEKFYGFSRAKVIEGPIDQTKQVFISNTSAFDSDGTVKVPNDVGKQTEQIVKNMENVLEQAGGNLTDIVETTFYTTSFDHFPEIAKVHQKYFGEISPATTLIHVSEMASPEILIEGSARAVISR